MSSTVSSSTTATRDHCAALLQHVRETESSLPEFDDSTQQFGHPSPPKLSMVELEGDDGTFPTTTTKKRRILLMTAHSERCVSACVFSSDKAIDVLVLMKEKITCIELIPRSKWSVAVVVGTSQSRVLSVELTCDPKRGTLSHVYEGAPAVEPLLLDTARTNRRDIMISEENDSAQVGSSLLSSGKKNVFKPDGGVSSILWHYLSSDGGRSFIWVCYGDGTIVRLSPMSFFSILREDEEIGDVAVRGQVMLTPDVRDAKVLACPRYHPSPLAPIPFWKPEELEASSTSGDEVYDMLTECLEAIAFDTSEPSLMFYTSEDQYSGRLEGDEYDRQGAGDENLLLDQAIGATTALVKGVVGTALGVVKWGLGSKPKETPHPPGQIDVIDNDPMETDEPMYSNENLLMALHGEPRRLYAGFEIYDTPRQITAVVIDPNGNLAAASDTLGRVLLIDLRLKQILRMWKGVRDANCRWSEINGELHLCIHSKQRRTIEMWKLQDGSKVFSLTVGRDAQLIGCRIENDGRRFARCFLLKSSRPDAKMCTIEEIVPSDHADDPILSRERSRPSDTIQKAAFRLRTLQQLLADTNVPCEKQDVFEALIQITALADLATALDILALSTTLEDRMGVTGADFQALALAHCKDVLEGATDKKGSTVQESEEVRLLKSRVQYHTQLVEAYSALNEFEEVNSTGDSEENDTERVAPRSAWAVEVTEWTRTYETVTGTLLDEKVKRDFPPAKFSTFAKACASPDQVKPRAGVERFVVYLTDSTRTRKDLLVHIFKPLLKDIFSFGVSNTIFELLGVKWDLKYMQQCFGEWFMSISIKTASDKGFYRLYSPMVRWLHELLGRQLEANLEYLNDAQSNFIVLTTLYDYCCEATDMVRAFLLAALCREAVATVTKKREAKTYGRIASKRAVKPWDDLLRKLRVALFVSLRLHKESISSLPITVKNVEAGDLFSVFDWVARDELSASLNHQEIVALEQACKISGLVFDPSTSEGDSPARWRLLQQACLASAISAQDRSEFLVDVGENVDGALLLYLSSYNSPVFLAAHRALLLAERWGRDPKKLLLLDACLEAMTSLEDEGPYKALGAAVLTEIWQIRIRPVFRAFLFGFGDVHELSEDVIGPLFNDKRWLKSVGNTGLVILNRLSRVVWDDEQRRLEMPDDGDGADSWPPVKPDFILKRMVSRSQPVEETACSTHRAIICGCLVSDDLGSLSACVENFYNSFEPMSLFQGVSMGGDTVRQTDFLEQGILGRARETNDRVLEVMDLGPIEILADLWGVEVRDVSTIFMLAMYEFGKDTAVDDLLLKSTQRMDMSRFIEDGVGIACRRLNRIMHVRRSPTVRVAMSLLDADTCEWVRDQAEMSDPLIDERDEARVDVPLSITHLFVLRLLSFSSALGIKEIRVKIHALSIMSGTLLKAIESG